MLQRRTLGNVVLRTHLRCPWVTHHCSPSRVFFSPLHSLFQNGDDGLILFCIISKILGQIKFYFISNTFTPMENLERKLQRPHRCTHTGKTCSTAKGHGLRNCTHGLLSNHLSSFTACLIHWVTFSQISHQTQIIYFISFFFFALTRL